MMKFRGILLLMSMMFVVAACGGNGEDEASVDTTEGGSEEVTLQFAHVLAPDHPYNLGAEKFKEVLEEADDSFTVEISHSAQLGSERDLTEGMQLGTVDIAIVPGTISAFEPMMGVLDLPYIMRDREHAYKVLDGEIGEELASSLPENNLRLLAYWENGFRNVTTSTHPIEAPEDLQGTSIRVPENEIYQTTFNHWGANVNTMAFGELFTALQQGTVDAQENPLALIETNNFYEAQNYLSLTEHFYGPAHVLMSEQTWQSLSEEQQEQVMNAAEVARDYERELLTEGDQEYLESLEENGMEINEVDTEAFRDSVQPIWDEYESEYGDLIERISNVE